ncbi:hypothetical protein JOE59_001700 [Agromyces cerinus]|uniref:hypothetical protein n=1 Tax=Agromyces cerinus TaxID=33878 RepID=UPI0019599D5C|nr:hypothetical protein [Agromyces cerinus]MBM7830995.1 hypothetical protein [Agromyces cerinus]
MTTLLSPDSGLLSGWAVRSGLGLASWGLQREARRNDRDRQQRRIDARATAAAALAERDALHRSAGFLPM